MAGRLRARGKGVDTHRVSISLPGELHRELEQIARQKKVSFAWVIRDAAEHYVENRWPLLAQKV
jgi:metal-responsive CopG/Arc/MetJ family transcriptional regulator